MKRFTFLTLVILLMITGFASGSAAAQDDLTSVTLFVSYIPSVQFAPIYVAMENGYFAEEGIEVTVEYSFDEPGGADRLAINDLQFGIISSDQVLIGRSVGKPLVYVYEWYHNYPVGIVTPADSGIEEPADLAGRVVGMPGAYGASYTGLRALLGANEMEESDLGELNSIGFTAPEAICTGLVEAAVVYIANEPLTIEQNCSEVTVITISDYVELMSNGLVTNEETIENNPELVGGMVRALRRGVEDTLADSDAAFEISLPQVPDLPEDQYETQRQVLENSLALWESENLGFSDVARWETSQAVMVEIGLMAEPLEDIEAAFNNEFIPVEEDAK